ncbi:MAG: prephenate dehydrogenase [Proteobacteria bacterium]|nr:prephenate dehydrogenase [Pseudomonadota bacterium]
MTCIREVSRAMVVGGSGAVGALLVQRLAAAGVPALYVVDRRSPRELPHVRWIQDDICNPSQQTLLLIESADLVILATPEEVAVASLGAVLPRMKQGSLLVDTLSVKTRIAQALAGIASQAELLGINPMFAPSLGFAGRSVVAVPYSAREQADAFLEFIRSQGSDVVRLSAEEHDRACAALQVATHAAVLSFGIALRAVNYDLTNAARIAPPPHRTLVVAGTNRQRRPRGLPGHSGRHPFAAEMRAQLAHRHLDDVVGEGNAESFNQLIVDLRSIFARSDVDYARLCARLFEVDPRLQ